MSTGSVDSLSSTTLIGSNDVLHPHPPPTSTSITGGNDRNKPGRMVGLVFLKFNTIVFKDVT
jgi:hypothetical protein